MHRSLVRPAAAALAAALALAACAPGPATGTRPRPAVTADAAKATRDPRVVPQATTAAHTRVTGQVFVIGLASGELARGDGSPIISNNGAGIISNNGSSVISNNGGRVISNLTGKLVSQTKIDLVSQTKVDLVSQTKVDLVSQTKGYALAQAGSSLEAFRLADADVALSDGAGRPLVDEAGKPLAARTDAAGAFQLDAVLPPGNLVARVKLKPGGELAALVVPEGAGQLTLRLDTSATLAATYVLERLVHGDAKVLDRLPRGLADRLQQELDVVGRYLRALPTYDPAPLVEAATTLGDREPRVARALDDVRQVLLGQADLGAGQPATAVPLLRPRGLVTAPDGSLYIAEGTVGRIRRVGADGKLVTYMDARAGQIKQNLVGLQALAGAPDGGLYAVSTTLHKVFRIGPDGAVQPVLGTGGTLRGALAAPLSTDTTPRAVAVGHDGTVYVGEDGSGAPLAGKSAPRVLALSPQGDLRALPGPDGWPDGTVVGLDVAPDGAVLALVRHPLPAVHGTLYRLAQGTSTVVAPDLAVDYDGAVRVAADGTIYVSEDQGGRVLAFGPAGAPTTVATLITPGPLGFGPKGELLAVELATGQVLRLDGAAPVAVAGLAGGDNLDAGNLAVNAPLAVAYDGQGRLLVSEGGSHGVRRLEGDRLVTIAGSRRGNAGDEGPATAARLFSPAGLAVAGDKLWILDKGNRAVRWVGADGTIHHAAGAPDGQEDRTVGAAVPAATGKADTGAAIAVAPDGRPYWTTEHHQIQRLSTRDGVAVIETVCGRPPASGPGADLALGGLLADPNEADPAKVVLQSPVGLAFDARGDLYVAEAAGAVVRKIVGVGGPAPRCELVAGIGAAATLQAAGQVAGGLPDEEGRRAREVAMVFPTALAFDQAGALYLAEAGTANLGFLGTLFAGGAGLDLAGVPQIPPRIRRIAPDGTITTVVGPRGRYLYDPAGPAALVLPAGLAIAPDGRLAILDLGANQVRVLPAGTL